EQERAQEALLDAEQRFRSAFESAPVGMTMTSLDGYFLRVNDAFAELVGRPAHDLLGRHVSDVSDARDAGEEALLTSALRGGKGPITTLEKRYVRPDGTRVWALLSASLLRDQAGRPLYWLTHAIDVDARQRATLERGEAQRRLADSLALLSGVIE